MTATRSAVRYRARSGVSAGWSPWSSRGAGAASSTFPPHPTPTPPALWSPSSPQEATRTRSRPARFERPTSDGWSAPPWPVEARRVPGAPSGAALITGGTGGLGAHTARWLARKGAEHLVLTSRHGGPRAGCEALRQELTGLGCRVTIAACDVADREALHRLVEQVESDGPAIRTVVHTAGVGMLASLADTDLDFFAEEPAPSCSAPSTSTNSSTTTGWTPSSCTPPSPAPGAAATTAPTRPPTRTSTLSPTIAGRAG